MAMSFNYPPTKLFFAENHGPGSIRDTQRNLVRAHREHKEIRRMSVLIATPVVARHRESPARI